MSKHTAGPWMISHNVVYALNGDDCNRFTAHIQAGHLDDDSRTGADEIKANVRLVAAAPDLLEALESLFEIGDVFGSAIEHKDPHCQSFDQWSDKARAAIAKARGEA